MGLFTRGKVWIAEDRNSYLEKDQGTGKLNIVVDGVTVGSVDATQVLALGTPVANIAEPTGGETEDAEARAAIADILEALEAFGIMEAGEGE